MAKRSKREWDMNTDTVRPIRFWNASAGHLVLHRYYEVENLRAHLGLYIETRRADLGTVIEMIDVTRGKVLCMNKHRADGVETTGGDDLFKLATS